VAEGDTILRAARRIEAALAGGTVEVSAPNPRGRAARLERLDGHAFERASAHGKHLLLHFGELVLHSHLGMSGSWHTYRRGEPWRKPVGAAWAVLSTERAEAVQFGGPTLRLLRAEALRRDPVLARLGPDILAADFDAERIARSRGSARGGPPPPPTVASATPCSTSTWSPASATSSRARPASPPTSTPGSQSPTCPTSNCATLPRPPTT
jgi:formamidopyrimidine-DNA glycosylase